MTKRESIQTISDIADRALITLSRAGISDKKISVMMDLEFIHEIMPLNLDQLLSFDDENFAHDITGIYAHWNRATKTMDDFFSPRCALPAPMEYVATVTLVHIELGDQVKGEFRGNCRYDVVRKAFAELTPMDQFDDDQEYKVLDVFAHTETVANG